MSNPRVFDPPLGFGSVVGDAELNALDTYASESINGVTGGVEAPAAPIIIGGAGFQVTGPFSATNATSIDVSAGGTLTLGVGVQIDTDVRSYPRVAHGPMYIDATKWGPDILSVGTWPGRLEQLATVNPATITDTLPFELEIPDGAELVQVQAFVHAASGHAALPTNRPQMQVYIYDAATGSSTAFGAPAVLSTGSIPAYETRTLLTVAAAPVVIDRSTKRVHVSLFGEGGAGFVAGLRWDTPIGTFTRDRIGEE